MGGHNLPPYLRFCDDFYQLEAVGRRCASVRPPPGHADHLLREDIVELVLPVSLSSGPSRQNPSFGALLVGSFIRFRPVGNGIISVYTLENDNSLGKDDFDQIKQRRR